MSDAEVKRLRELAVEIKALFPGRNGSVTFHLNGRHPVPKVDVKWCNVGGTNDKGPE